MVRRLKAPMSTAYRRMFCSAVELIMVAAAVLTAGLALFDR